MTDYLKLTSYFAERLRHGDQFLSDSLLDLYGDHAVATSVVLRGIASFGPHHELRSDQSLSLSEDSPIAIAAVDTADKMAGLADQVSAMVSRGLVTLERASSAGQRRHPTPPSSPSTSAARIAPTDGPPTARCVRCCTDSDSRAHQCFSASTAPRAVSVSGLPSSAVTSMFR